MNTQLDKEKAEIALSGRVRDLVFGVQDGLISLLGLLCGVQSATDDSHVVIITGFAAMFTGALSMATGAYLSTQAEKEIFEKEIKEEEKFVKGHPFLAHEALVEELSKEGFSHEKACDLAKIFSRHKVAYLKTFQEKVLGLGAANLSKPFLSAVVMYFAFVLGAFVPIFPYFIFNVDQGVWVSVGLSAGALFLFGVFKSYLAQKSLWRGGLEFLLIALVSAALGWGVGQFLAPGVILP